jgi:hypothetical protein
MMTEVYVPWTDRSVELEDIILPFEDIRRLLWALPSSRTLFNCQQYLNLITLNQLTMSSTNNTSAIVRSHRSSELLHRLTDFV